MSAFYIYDYLQTKQFLQDFLIFYRLTNVQSVTVRLMKSNTRFREKLN